MLFSIISCPVSDYNNLTNTPNETSKDINLQESFDTDSEPFGRQTTDDESWSAGGNGSFNESYTQDLSAYHGSYIDGIRYRFRVHTNTGDYSTSQVSLTASFDLSSEIDTLPDDDIDISISAGYRGGAKNEEIIVEHYGNFAPLLVENAIPSEVNLTVDGNTNKRGDGAFVEANFEWKMDFARNVPHKHNV